MSEAAAGELPSALERGEEIFRRLEGGAPVVLLDFDGTLAPIARDPGRVRPTEGLLRTLERLAARCPVAVISGRDARDVRDRVGVEGLWYAGSHGLDLVSPAGDRRLRGEEARPALDRAEDRLRDELGEIAGVEVERKELALAVHYRGASETVVDDLERAVGRALQGEPDLRRSEGKKVFELRPRTEWDKGRAVEHILGRIGDEDAVPLYLGDDLTDEDAFRALRGRGIGILVRGEDRPERTAAGYTLSGPREVATFLASVAAFLAGEAGT